MAINPNLDRIKTEYEAGRTSPALFRELLDFAIQQEKDWIEKAGEALGYSYRLDDLQAANLTMATYIAEAEQELINLRQANERQQAELSVIDEALGEFHCKVDGGGSFFKDHGVHLAIRRIEELEAGNTRLAEQVGRLMAELERAGAGEVSQ